jgi:hypothetical protein
MRQVTRTHAEKSALPVAAREVSNESLLDQTAPLWPNILKNISIQH